MPSRDCGNSNNSHDQLCCSQEEPTMMRMLLLPMLKQLLLVMLLAHLFEMELNMDSFDVPSVSGCHVEWDPKLQRHVHSWNVLFNPRSADGVDVQVAVAVNLSDAGCHLLVFCRQWHQKRRHRMRSSVTSEHTNAAGGWHCLPGLSDAAHATTFPLRVSHSLPTALWCGAVHHNPSTDLLRD